LCNACQFKCKSTDCSKKQQKKEAIDPDYKLCNVCYKPSEQPKIEIKIKKNYIKFFKCPVKDCEKWKRIDAMKELKGSKMCKVCFNKMSGKNKEKNEK
jgi:hypothetical protein